MIIPNYSRKGIADLIFRLKHNRVNMTDFIGKYLHLSDYKWRKYLKSGKIPKDVMLKLMVVYGANWSDMYEPPPHKITIMPMLVKQNPIRYSADDYSFIKSEDLSSQFKYATLYDYLIQLEEKGVNVSRYCNHHLYKSPKHIRQCSVGIRQPSLQTVYRLASITHTTLNTWLHRVEINPSAACSVFPEGKSYYDDYLNTREIAKMYDKEAKNLKPMLISHMDISYLEDGETFLVPKYELENLNQWLVNNTSWRRIIGWEKYVSR